MSETLVDCPQDLQRIFELLACPWCRAPVRWTSAGLRCSGCPAEFPAQEGIVDLARRGTAATWGASESSASSQKYQEAYAELPRAQDYNRAYEVRTLKRLSTQRERHLIARLLGARGKAATLLELPCGGGRLSPSFARWTELLIQADTGWGQLLHAARRPSLGTPRILMAASGFHVPFRDASVDCIACVRLSHHLPTSEERHRLLHELLRVARRTVLMTFFDHHSLKNRLRQRTNKPPKMTMTVDEVAAVAREHGAKLLEAPMLSWVGSGHRYALMIKDP
jgi:SAM-dependent methyltransferase